jgi:hypothetical protein
MEKKKGGDREAAGDGFIPYMSTFWLLGMGKWPSPALPTMHPQQSCWLAVSDRFVPRKKSTATRRTMPSAGGHCVSH